MPRPANMAGCGVGTTAAPNVLCGVGFISQGSMPRPTTDGLKPRESRAAFILKVSKATSWVTSASLWWCGGVGTGLRGCGTGHAAPRPGGRKLENHTNAFQLVPEELTITYAGMDARTSADPRRHDLLSRRRRRRRVVDRLDRPMLAAWGNKQLCQQHLELTETCCAGSSIRRRSQCEIAPLRRLPLLQ